MALETLTPTILILDDDELSRISFLNLCKQLNVKKLNLLAAATIEDGFKILKEKRVDVLLLDKNFQKPSGEIVSSLDHIPTIINQQPNIQIVIVTGHGDTQDVVKSIRLGAFGFLKKEDPTDMLICQVEKALEVSKLALAKLYSGKTQTSQVLGAKSAKMKSVLDQAKAFSQNKFPVLITGETGTGKTALAEFIHNESISGKSYKPFVSINISALPTSIVERELFGSEKGAFTDAKELKRGFFELANEGTLFLDEIGDVSLELQVKLLKVIEQKKFYRLGGDKEVQSNFKLICATNRNLEELIKEGTFREDLFMRISTLSLHIPPLSERKEDIIPIIEAALPRWAAQGEIQVTFQDLPKDLLEFIKDNPGMGNIRGIEQQLFRVLSLSPRLIGGKVDFSNWKDALQFSASSEPANINQFLAQQLKDKNFQGIDHLMEQLERTLFEECAKLCSSNKEIAEFLKTSTASVSKKLSLWGLKPKV